MNLGVVQYSEVTGRVAGNARRRPCACGIDIVAILDDDGIQLAVAAHQTTEEHQAYRIRMGWPPKLPRSMYPATAAGRAQR